MINNMVLEEVLKINRSVLVSNFANLLENTVVTCLWVGDGFPISIAMSPLPRAHSDFRCKVVVYNPLQRIMKK